MQLHHYYEVLVEKVPLEVAHIVVWEGAAKNRKIKTHISDIVDENSYLVISGNLLHNNKHPHSCIYSNWDWLVT